MTRWHLYQMAICVAIWNKVILSILTEKITMGLSFLHFSSFNAKKNNMYFYENCKQLNNRLSWHTC